MIYNINVITNNKFSMKKNRLTLVAAIFLSGTILFSSCVGSFGLFNRFSCFKYRSGIWRCLSGRRFGYQFY